MRFGESSEHKLTAQEFFARLTWEQFRDRLAETLKDPHVSVPQNIECPAVMTLFRGIVQSLGETAIQKPGEPLTPENVFHLDQRLALARILETLVRMAEENPVSSRGQIEGYPESPIERAIGKSKLQLNRGDNENT